MRIYLSGPHLGPLHTTLWSWPPRRLPASRRPRRTARRGRRWWPQALGALLVIGAVSKAYQAALWLGVLVTVVTVVTVVLGAYGMTVSARGTESDRGASPVPPAGRHGNG